MSRALYTVALYHKASDKLQFESRFLIWPRIAHERRSVVVRTLALDPPEVKVCNAYAWKSLFF